MKLTVLLVTLLSLIACTKDAPPTTPDNSGGGEPVAGEDHACSADDDCVAVELGCCDECNGGEAVGAHKDHVDQIVAASPRGQGTCDEVACTEMACPTWIPSCQAGQCEIIRGSFE